ncbi:hypothetical protein IMZ48_35875, partial [Candidatus Bathyarchaeota archaeon]|nr:hypothetical protein [Candidatus Bathyarchaeota archaeon]
TRDREATVGWYRSRLFEAHAKYRKLHADQCRLMEDGLYARSLAASLSRMPRFRSLRIDDEDDYLDESFCIGYEDDEDTQEAYGVRGGIFHYEMDIPLVLRDGMILMETMTRWYRWSSVECIADEQEHQGRRPQAENLAMGIIFDLPMAILQAGITLRDFDLRCFPVTARGQSLVDPARRGGDFSAAFRRLEHCRVYISENTEYDWRTRPDDRFGAADRYIAAAVSSPALRALHLDLGVGMLEARRNYPAATVLAAVTSDRIAEVSLIRLKADGADLASFSSKLSDGFRDVSYDWLELTGGSWWPIMRTLVVKRSACGKGRIGRLNTWPLEGRECAAAFREYMRGIRDPRIYFFLDSPTSGKVVVRSEPTARSHSLCKYLEKRGIGL